MKNFGLGAVTIVCGLIQSSPLAAGPSPNLPICTRKPCTFFNEVEYAQNGVGITLRNEEALRRIAQQADRRMWATTGGPLLIGVESKKWWFDSIKVTDVTQDCCSQGHRGSLTQPPA